ncbi:MAG: hypothetical protein ACQER6_04740 [Pseudomonadota bacterium]
MNTWKILIGLSSLSPLVLSSCAIGPGGICGPQTPLYECMNPNYPESIKPYLHYWVKPGMTEESQRQDSWECGAAPTELAAEHVIFPDKVLESEKQAHETTDVPAINRLRDKWGDCMKEKGYEYVWTGRPLRQEAKP